MKRISQLVMVIIITTFLSTPALSATVSWTDWVSAPDSYSASGDLLIGATTVGVDYTGTSLHRFVHTGQGGDFWRGTAYTNGTVENKPPASELVGLFLEGTVTISFTETVTNPYLALISWNGNTVDFGVPITFDSYGEGHFGTGTPILNDAGTGFYGNGEVHGVIQLMGDYDSITFTHTTESWHGFTVGAANVPVPAAVWLFGSGLIGLVGIKRKSKN